VLDICRAAKPSIGVKRARFSALVPSEIRKAINQTVDPNKREADAVEARSILDLRSGAAFTRFQTLLLQDRFDWAARGVFQVDRDGNARERLLISFGSCQYPTLGLIVKRHW
jgi:DNA topoisomerase III